MGYFVTGGTGFLGRYLVSQLLFLVPGVTADHDEAESWRAISKTCTTSTT